MNSDDDLRELTQHPRKDPIRVTTYRLNGRVVKHAHCPVCKEAFALTKEAAIPAHDDRMGRCSGSNHKPTQLPHRGTLNAPSSKE